MICFSQFLYGVAELLKHIYNRIAKDFCLQVFCLNFLWLSQSCSHTLSTGDHFEPTPSLHRKYMYYYTVLTGHDFLVTYFDNILSEDDKRVNRQHVCTLREGELVVVCIITKSFAPLLYSGLSCGLYTTNSADICQYIASDCQANVVVVENDMQLQKFLKVHKIPFVQ